MLMEKYVTSLEMSKKLAEAGIEFDTEFVWFLHDAVNWKLQSRESLPYEIAKYRIINPFLTDELLEILPKSIMSQIDHPYMGILKKNSAFFLDISMDDTKSDLPFYVGYNLDVNEPWITDRSLPNALAKLTLWCKENGYLEVNNENE